MTDIQMVILAGGLATRLGYLTKDPPCIFCYTHGDSHLLVDFPAVIRYFESNDKLALMTVYKNNDRFDKSHAAVEGVLSVDMPSG